MDETISKVLGTNNTANTQYAVSYRVYKDGTVELPFLKPIHVEGLTVDEAQETIQTAFREIIPDADVKVALYNKTFTVIGDIRSGEYFIYKEKLNIFQALAMTGDLMNSGDRKHVRIIRPHGDQEPEVLEFDIRSNTIIDSKYYYVQPNDVIYVARTKDSFVKVPSYTGVLGLITSSVSLLVSVLNYSLLLSK
jgi:polysaccharide export outer membrane protein